MPEKQTIHIRGIEGTQNERVLIGILENSVIMDEYKKQFVPGSRIPAMSINDIGSLMEDATQRFKSDKRKTKHFTPERKELRMRIREFNKAKRAIKKQIEDIQKMQERKVVDDYEPEM